MCRAVPFVDCMYLEALADKLELVQMWAHRGFRAFHMQAALAGWLELEWLLDMLC